MVHSLCSRLHNFCTLVAIVYMVFLTGMLYRVSCWLQLLKICLLLFFFRCGHEFCYTCGKEWTEKKATCSCLLWDEPNIITAQRWLHMFTRLEKDALISLILVMEGVLAGEIWVTGTTAHFAGGLSTRNCQVINWVSSIYVSSQLLACGRRAGPRP